MIAIVNTGVQPVVAGAVAGDQPVLAGAGAGVRRDENKTKDDEPENKTENEEPEIPVVQAQPVHPDPPGLAGLAMAVGVPIQDSRSPTWTESS